MLRHAISIAAAGLLVAAAGLSAEDLSIGSFANNSTDGWTFSIGKEFKGAQGNFAILDGLGPNSSCVAYLEGAFGLGGAYVAIDRRLATPVPFKALKFMVKSSDFDSLTIRLTDSTGQVHQQVVSLKETSGWQSVEVKSYKGKGSGGWGGAKDGKWHDPLNGVSLLLEHSGLKDGANSGKALFADISLSK